MGMICGCLPCLKPLFDRGIKSATQGGTRTYGLGTHTDETADWKVVTKSNQEKKMRAQSMRLDSDTSLHALKENPVHTDKIQKTTTIEWSSTQGRKEEMEQ